MIQNLFIFAVSLFLVAKGATMATKYAARLAQGLQLSKYTVGFIIVAVISLLPETFISINSALEGMPSFGLGVLFGSNVADMTLVFVIILLCAGRGIKIESKILKNNRVYSLLLLLPLVLGLDGRFSRAEGLVLIIVGAVFYYLTFRKGSRTAVSLADGDGSRLKNFLLLFVGMFILLVGSHFTVKSAVALADFLKISPILIGMLVVSVGTCMPELFFSLKSLKRRDDSLAVGDILGTVFADATVVIGVLALINPFSFPPKIVYVTGAFMLGASIILLQFMRSGRVLSKKEGLFLFLYWLIFVLVEFFVNK